MIEFVNVFALVLTFGFGFGSLISAVAVSDRVSTKGPSYHTRAALVYLLLTAVFAGIVSVTG